MIAMTGELALDSWDRTSGEDNRGRTTLTLIGKRHLGQDSPDNSVWTGRPDSSALLGQPG
jgi:hypothetical protein